MWTLYVVSYLDTGKIFGRILQTTGRLFCGLELIFIAVNIFRPVLFWFDENNVYQAGYASVI